MFGIATMLLCHDFSLNDVGYFFRIRARKTRLPTFIALLVVRLEQCAFIYQNDLQMTSRSHHDAASAIDHYAGLPVWNRLTRNGDSARDLSSSAKPRLTAHCAASAFGASPFKVDCQLSINRLSDRRKAGVRRCADRSSRGDCRSLQRTFDV